MTSMGEVTQLRNATGERCRCWTVFPLCQAAAYKPMVCKTALPIISCVTSDKSVHLVRSMFS